MRVFLDTEFTNFLGPRLLSLGMVTFSGTLGELYAELDMASDEGRRRRKASGDFTRSTVLTQWGRVPGAACSEYELGRRAGRWLIALAERAQAPLEIVYDDKTDADLLEAALDVSGLLEPLKPRLEWYIVSYLRGNPIVAAAQAASWARSFESCGLERHHALADARALRDGFIAIHGADGEQR